MTLLSVNINKFATLRNARGGNTPNIVDIAIDCQKFGAEGITVHPRPDERHITANDVFALKKVITTEFNIEGYPNERYIDLIKKVKPEQATLVPDGPNAITSDAGWDIKNYSGFLKEIIQKIKPYCKRVSIFIEADKKTVEQVKALQVERVELYTGPYALQYNIDREQAISKYYDAYLMAEKIGIGVNAGHDLNLKNLKYLYQKLNGLKEVSIGHALVCDALYLGLENTVNMYKRCLCNISNVQND